MVLYIARYFVRIRIRLPGAGGLPLELTDRIRRCWGLRPSSGGWPLFVDWTSTNDRAIVRTTDGLPFSAKDVRWTEYQVYAAD